MFVIQEEKLAAISQLLLQNTGMPVFTINLDGSLRDSYYSYILGHPLFPNREKLFSQLFFESDKYGVPFIRATNDYECYIGIKLQDQERTPYFFVMGPSATLKVTASSIYELLIQYQVPMQLKDTLNGYYVSLPVYSKQRVIHFAQLAYFLIFNDSIDDALVVRLSSWFPLPSSNQMNLELYLLNQRVMDTTHFDYIYEKNTMRLIKEGRHEEIAKSLSFPPPAEEMPTVTKNNKVRNDKNLAITAITIACRAAIEGGLDSKISYSLSEMFIDRIESKPDFPDLFGTIREAYLEYARRVKEALKHNYSPGVLNAQQYIHNHLYQKIELQQLADHVHLNGSYLSRLFKKEVGMTITEYIHREKVHEAKKWLTFSKLSISEIATQLQFHDQSHFIKTFSRIERMTPKQYRIKPE
ncbi:helix-turn-helix domain-containing protein [Paenibacillus antibioticophila]|uniref:helix-turn-helix domain-containing protein n=1 Tax=Paenibacillus antibioticophila TaxID=1274374 RepID=UPI0005C902D4|nr:helix-turn-helix domain-containing protein [Paenibacillus antibioticophila]